MKKCSKCGIEKPDKEFKERKSCCRICKNAQTKAWKRANPEKQREYGKKWREANPEKQKEYKKTWEKANPEKQREYKKKWRGANIEIDKERKKEWRKANPEKCRDTVRKWRKANPERYLSYNKTAAEKIKNTPFLLLRAQIRSAIRGAINRGGYDKKSKTSQLVGISYEMLMFWLEYSWFLNYGTEYHGQKVDIDHIIPCATATTEEELIALQHWTNLQYLTPEDNATKGDRYRV